MAKCKKCGAEIVFKEHPQNPERMVPFNMDGEIHFATCPAKKDDQRRYDSIDDIEQVAACGWKAKFVRYHQTSAGQITLRSLCGCGGQHYVTSLPMNEENKELINL